MYQLFIFLFKTSISIKLEIDCGHNFASMYLDCCNKNTQVMALLWKNDWHCIMTQEFFGENQKLQQEQVLVVGTNQCLLADKAGGLTRQVGQ
jgi:hypothetical protein